MTDANLNGAASKVRITDRLRNMANSTTEAIDSANEASKRMEETANWVAVALACVAALSMVALGVAVVALIGCRGCGDDETESTGT